MHESADFVLARPLRRVALLTVLLAALSGAGSLAGPASAQTCGDVNESGTVTTSDALNVLKVAVGQDVELLCSGDCAELDPRVEELEVSLATALTALAGMQEQLEDVSALLAGLSRTENALVLSGANFQVVDGTGATAGPVNGLGNIIIGYNEATLGQDHTGSHNLVVGLGHEYTSFAGIVAGEQNTISARSASVLGGSANKATGLYSTVGGGFANTASGGNAAISGGCESTASGTYASVSGGQLATASASWAAVSGGYKNSATGQHASVSGGSTHSATTQFNWKAGSLDEPQ